MCSVHTVETACERDGLPGEYLETETSQASCSNGHSSPFDDVRWQHHRCRRIQQCWGMSELAGQLTRTGMFWPVEAVSKHP